MSSSLNVFTNLHPLCLLYETIPSTFTHSIYKPYLSANDQLNISFVDIGHGSMQAYPAGCIKGQLGILNHLFDRSLVGRDLDEVLF